MKKVLLSGNEAIAKGAWEAGVSYGVGYPGTPSTETLEYFSKLEDTHAEWAPNEKVALEVALGLSMMGKRSLVTMKHVGVNVAADPLFTSAYTGVGGGLVILAADDPGMHSSQNEQDSRNYAAFARVPLLEPSDSDEARRFTKLAFTISEEFDIPTLIRSTVRISHTKSLVQTEERREYSQKDYEKNPGKWVMMPGMARRRRRDLDTRINELTTFAREQTGESDDCLNRIEKRDDSIGIICSGATYQYVREAAPNASVLKLGLSFPLDKESIAAFTQSVKKFYVIEEANDYLERSIRAFGLTPEKTSLPIYGELSPELIRCQFGDATACEWSASEKLPERPPLLCPGCPHRVVFSELRRINALVTGDIGCYTLGALPPLSSIDSCVDMGASISMAHGVELAGGIEGRPTVAVIGDSTFAHSGMTSLVNTVYNQGTGLVAILDNRSTAMTGHQGNPVNGVTLAQGKTRELQLEPLVKALGVSHVRKVDAQDIKAVRRALREEIARGDELSVIIFEAPCALLIRERKSPYTVDQEKCTSCGVCRELGCSAIAKSRENAKTLIDANVCVGCAQCEQVCAFGAISEVPASTEGGC